MHSVMFANVTYHMDVTHTTLYSILKVISIESYTTTSMWILSLVSIKVFAKTLDYVCVFCLFLV